jgi:hypothetical protein
MPGGDVPGDDETGEEQMETQAEAIGEGQEVTALETIC